MMPAARYARLAAVAATTARAAAGAIDARQAEIVTRKRGRANFATVADHAVQEAILARLAARDPAIRVLAEEQPRRDTGRADRLWVVDPIDGTLNFSRGLPFYAVVIGYVEESRVRAAAIHAPALGETFVASEGAGATLNGRPIHVSGVRRLTSALAVASLGWRAMRGARPRMARIAARCAGMRDVGSAALGIAYVADGRFDLFAHEFLAPWDVAGPQLIAREAGAMVVSLRTGEDAAWDERQVLIGPPGLVRDALRAIPDLVRR